MRIAGLVVALISVFAADLCHSQQNQRPEAIDISSHIFRGLAIPDEPSIKAKYDVSGYAGFRLFEYEAMTPIRIVRVERSEGAAQLAMRTFESTGALSTLMVKAFDAARWHQLVTVIALSGFWTAEGRDDLWIPEGLKWLVEGCENGTFHSLLLYPEGDRRMDDVADFMAAIAK
jgi:hypothetical protein